MDFFDRPSNRRSWDLSRLRRKQLENVEWPELPMDTIRRLPRYHNFLNSPGSQILVTTDFEVYGNVQGVYFAKYCKEMANGLQLRGWVRSSRQGTVVGQIQGEKEKVDDMAMWLRVQGSPGSRVEHVAFRNWNIIDGYDYRDFRALY